MSNTHQHICSVRRRIMFNYFVVIVSGHFSGIISGHFVGIVSGHFVEIISGYFIGEYRVFSDIRLKKITIFQSALKSSKGMVLILFLLQAVLKLTNTLTSF